MSSPRDRQADARRILASRRPRRPSARTVLRAAAVACGVGHLAGVGARLPGIVIAGAMRAGTTSLFSLLAGHPKVAAAFRKEVHYFDLHFHRGPDWYRRQFRRTRSTARGCVEGVESSPYYMFDDPAYLSGLHQYYSYAARGRYAEQLMRWQTHFPAMQMLVVDAGRLFAAPAEVLAEVLAFVGLEPWTPPQFDRLNAGQVRMPLDPHVASTLAATFAPHERRLSDLVGWCPSMTGRITAATPPEAA